MKIFIPETANQQYRNMFTERGYEIVRTVAESNLVLFIGGADVNPALYNEKVHPTTHYNHATDERDIAAYKAAQANGIPCVGICRGGQFLNVMNNGCLYQNVDNHTRSHEAYLIIDEDSGFMVSSTHHQMMIPSRRGYVRLIARKSTTKEFMPLTSSRDSNPIVDSISDPHIDIADFYDVEAVWYPDTSCYCFQPHPEFDGYEQCRDFFFNEINTLIFGEDYGYIGKA